MKEPSAAVGSPPVPAFLMKLWALVEDPSNTDVITWSVNGDNFCILDEQRFSKEILPKYFKHSNLSSFIRQLNMYGFRKVMSLESGLVKSDRASYIEFQHPYFKRGKSDLLENIKRKMPSVKPEDPHLTQEDLQKVVMELQDLKDVQSNMDTKLENMRRDNTALWNEVSYLRKRHNQQQRLLSKILQFILGLMRGNIVMSPNRKRELTLEPSQSPPAKYSGQIIQIPEGVEEVHSSPNPGSSRDQLLEIPGIFNPGEGTSEASAHTVEPSQNVPILPSAPVGTDDSIQEVLVGDSVLQSLADPSQSNASDEQALDVVQASTAEDQDSVLNSILNESCAQSNLNLLDRDDLQDFLSSIDASLEELQGIFSQKKLSVASDVIDELFKPDLSSSDTPVVDTNASIVNVLQQEPADAAVSGSKDHLNKEKQLMQYRGNPLLSLFDVPSSHHVAASVDPEDLLGTLDGPYPCSSAVQDSTAVQDASNQAADLLAEGFSGSDELPLLALSSVKKLLEEEADSERH